HLEVSAPVNHERRDSVNAIRKENQSMRRIFRAALLLGVLLPATHLPASAVNERLVFDGNVLWNNMQTVPTQLPWAATSGPCSTFTSSTTALGTTFFPHNRTNIDPKLVDPYNLSSPRWDP